MFYLRVCFFYSRHDRISVFSNPCFPSQDFLFQFLSGFLKRFNVDFLSLSGLLSRNTIFLDVLCFVVICAIDFQKWGDSFWVVFALNFSFGWVGFILIGVDHLSAVLNLLNETFKISTLIAITAILIKH